MGRLIFGNLSGDRNIPGDRYIQGRCLTVFSLTVFYKQIKLILTTKVLHLASFWKEEFLKLGDCLFPSFCCGFVGSYVGAGDRPYHRLCKIFSFSFIALGFRGERCPKASHYFWNFDIFSQGARKAWKFSVSYLQSFIERMCTVGKWFSSRCESWNFHICALNANLRIWFLLSRTKPCILPQTNARTTLHGLINWKLTTAEEVFFQWLHQSRFVIQIFYIWFWKRNQHWCLYLFDFNYFL